MMNMLYINSNVCKELSLSKSAFCRAGALGLSPDYTAVLFSSDKVRGRSFAQIWTQADTIRLLPRVTGTCFPVSISPSVIL